MRNRPLSLWTLGANLAFRSVTSQRARLDPTTFQHHPFENGRHRKDQRPSGATAVRRCFFPSECSVTCCEHYESWREALAADVELTSTYPVIGVGLQEIMWEETMILSMIPLMKSTAFELLLSSVSTSLQHFRKSRCHSFLLCVGSASHAKIRSEMLKKLRLKCWHSGVVPLGMINCRKQNPMDVCSWANIVYHRRLTWFKSGISKKVPQYTTVVTGDGTVITSTFDGCGHLGTGKNRCWFYQINLDYWSHVSFNKQLTLIPC